MRSARSSSPHPIRTGWSSSPVRDRLSASGPELPAHSHHLPLARPDLRHHRGPGCHAHPAQPPPADRRPRQAPAPGRRRHGDTAYNPDRHVEAPTIRPGRSSQARHRDPDTDELCAPGRGARGLQLRCRSCRHTTRVAIRRLHELDDAATIARPRRHQRVGGQRTATTFLQTRNLPLQPRAHRRP
jgi:hypothetical protein